MALTLDDSNLSDDLTLNTGTLTAYSLPDDGYVYYSATHDMYADKIYFGCNDSADNWEQVELTAEILDANPQLYMEYDSSLTYAEGTHLLVDGALVKIEDGEVKTLVLAENLTLHTDSLTDDEDDDTDIKDTLTDADDLEAVT